MRDLKRRSERIEPRIDGSDSVELDSSASFGSPSEMRDILMDAPSRQERRSRSGPSDSRRAERDVVDDALVRQRRPVRSARRAQGYERASPRSNSYSGFKTALSFTWFKPAHLAYLILLSVFVGFYWAAEPISQFLERPFKSVVVEGDFHHVSKQRATELISQEIDNNFLKLDLMRIKDVLVADPWVDTVTLQRRWPDTLVVRIKEQKPIARWGEGFLNQRGEIVKVEDASVLSELPWLQGSEANAGEILQQYLTISQVLRTRGLDVIALKCDDKKAWRLTLNNNVELVLGRGELLQKIDRFIDVYNSQLNSVWSDVVSIDARYSNGIAVRWLEGSDSAQRYLKPDSKRGA